MPILFWLPLAFGALLPDSAAQSVDTPHPQTISITAVATTSTTSDIWPTCSRASTLIAEPTETLISDLNDLKPVSLTSTV